ncbi:MAG: hypothetical protein GWP06_00980, partial [Actinobacteria bacterium]|nr:hypothetical protein [Actinomycetota bacterium]
MKKLVLFAAMLFLASSASFAKIDEFFDTVNYKGAFGSSIWASDWTALSQYGLLVQPATTGAEIVTVTDADIPPN